MDKRDNTTVLFSANYWPTIEATTIRIQKFYSLRSVMPGAIRIFIDSVRSLEISLAGYMDKKYKEQVKLLEKPYVEKLKHLEKTYREEHLENEKLKINEAISESKWSLLVELMRRKNITPSEKGNFY